MRTRGGDVLQVGQRPQRRGAKRRTLPESQPRDLLRRYPATDCRAARSRARDERQGRAAARRGALARRLDPIERNSAGCCPAGKNSWSCRCWAVGVVVVGFEVSMCEFVTGDTDALERFDQQGDDVRGDKFVVSVWQPVAIQFPTIFCDLARLPTTRRRHPTDPPVARTTTTENHENPAQLRFHPTSRP